MITCVSVYLASGTISTLEHSAHAEHSIWNWSAKPLDFGARSLALPTPGPSTVGPSTTRSHLLFPKSIKGEGYYNTPPPNPTTRVTPAPATASLNGTFLAQKARVSTRNIKENNVSSVDRTASAIESLVSSVDNEKNESCNRSPEGQSVLSVRFQGSPLVAPFYICRQLWWHYVSMAGNSYEAHLLKLYCLSELFSSRVSISVERTVHRL